MTREEANAELTRLDLAIDEIKRQKEAIAIEHNLMLTEGEYNTNYFFPTREAFMKHFRYREEDMSWIDRSNSFPGWISSNEMY